MYGTWLLKARHIQTVRSALRHNLSTAPPSLKRSPVEPHFARRCGTPETAFTSKRSESPRHRHRHPATRTEQDHTPPRTAGKSLSRQSFSTVCMQPMQHTSNPKGKELRILVYIISGLPWIYRDYRGLKSFIQTQIASDKFLCKASKQNELLLKEIES